MISGMLRCSSSCCKVGRRVCAFVLVGGIYQHVRKCCHQGVTFVRRMCDCCSGTSHLCGKFIDGASGFEASTKLIPTISRLASLRNSLIPWNRQVSPAQRRVQDTQRGNSPAL